MLYVSRNNIVQILADTEIYTVSQVDNRLTICLRSTSAMSVEYSIVVVTLNCIFQLGKFFKNIAVISNIKFKKDYIDKIQFRLSSLIKLLSVSC